MKTLILASASPRRIELMRQIGLYPQVIPSDCEENVTGLSPEETVSELSRLKCVNVYERISPDNLSDINISADGYVVIGADTIVVLDDKIMGKPSSEEDAVNMLTQLSGRAHKVYTGVTICDSETNVMHTFTEQTEVVMYELDGSEIYDYVNSGEPMDKAGAYGIQGIGARLIKEIHGDYFNVVGLPVARLNRELKKFMK